MSLCNSLLNLSLYTAFTICHVIKKPFESPKKSHARSCGLRAALRAAPSSSVHSPSHTIPSSRSFPLWALHMHAACSAQLGAHRYKLMRAGLACNLQCEWWCAPISIACSLTLHASHLHARLACILVPRVVPSSSARHSIAKFRPETLF